MRAYICQCEDVAVVTFASTWDAAYAVACEYFRFTIDTEEVCVIEYNYSEHGDSRDYQEI